jgi:hypothetical protein
MIDITSESLLPIGKAPAEVERLTGERPHRTTIDRWRMRGCHGVKLETVKIGGKRYVSREALQRFIEAVTAAADRELPSPLDHISSRRRATKRAPAVSVHARILAKKPDATDLRADVQVVLAARCALSVDVIGLSLEFLARLGSLLLPACILACGFNVSTSTSISSNRDSGGDQLIREPLATVPRQYGRCRHGRCRHARQRPAGRTTETQEMK